MNNKVITPVVTLDYPYLTKPATNLDANGNYEATVYLDESDPGTKEFLGKVKAAFDAAITAAKMKNPKARAGKPPIRKAEDGRLFFKTKRKAAIGAPKLFDTANRPWDMTRDIYSGAKAILCIQIGAYDDRGNGYGISLRLDSAQIHSVGTKAESSGSASPFAALASAEDNPFAAAEATNEATTETSDDSWNF